MVRLDGKRCSIHVDRGLGLAVWYANGWIGMGKRILRRGIEEGIGNREKGKSIGAAN